MGGAEMTGGKAKDTKAPPSRRQELAMPRGRRARRIESHYINTGYYPGYDVLDQQAHWDQPTWEAIRRRMEEIPPIRFFTRHEAETYRALCDWIVGQNPGRDPWTVPIVNFLDHKLHLNQTDGYRFVGMPPMREAFRHGAAAVDESAREMFGREFVALEAEQQRAVVERLAANNPPGRRWRRLNPKHFWHVLTVATVAIFYAHPYLWNEIGFGGPAYPRGYMRLTSGEAEPWEAREDRLARAGAASGERNAEEIQKPAA
ncbi:MAG: gluconate 2-dehydrogenase subunit 3 family protein [Terriglobales bacterium]